MKKTTFKKFLASILAGAMLLCLASCGYEKPVTTDEEEFYLAKNDVMDDGTKADLNNITETFEAYLNGGDIDGVKALLDPEFQTTDDQLNQFAALHTGKTVALYDTYYIKDVEPATTVIKVKKSAEDENSIELTPGSSEMYTALYTAEADSISYMITLLCAKQGRSWKIVWMDATDYKYNGEDAAAIYSKVSACNEEGKTLAAYVHSLRMNLVSRPGNALVYKDFDTYQDLYYQMGSEFQKLFPMPYTPEGMADTVKVHTVALANENDQIIPLIILQTDIALSDSAALKAQAEQVIDAMESVSAGFKAEFSQVAFNVLNDDPTTAQNPEVENFVISTQK